MPRRQEPRAVELLACKNWWRWQESHTLKGCFAYIAQRQVGYSHLDVHISHLQILARLEGFEPPPNRVETGRSNPLSYKRMAESDSVWFYASKPNPIGSLGLASQFGPWPIHFPTKHSDLQVGRYSNWDVSRWPIKLKADIFRRAIKQHYRDLTLRVRSQIHLIDHHVSTFNAAVNPVNLSFFTGEPVLLGWSFWNTAVFGAARENRTPLSTAWKAEDAPRA